MEIAAIVMIGVGLIEGLILLKLLKDRNDLLKANNTTLKLLEEMDKLDKKNRFSNPLGDGYRKNLKGQYKPIKPYSEEKEDEV